MFDSVRTELRALMEPGYQKFSASLLPGVDGIQGIRLPLLRKTAKELIKSGQWRDWLEEYWLLENRWFEEDLLAGFCIGLAKLPPEETLELLLRFIPRITNWSVCDSFCASLKTVAENPGFFFPEIQKMVGSAEEFTVRAGAVLLLDHYRNAEWRKTALKTAAQICHPGYYARMAAAWAISVFYPEETETVLLLLKEPDFPPDIRKLTLQKIRDSRRVPAEEKRMLSEVFR